MIRMNNDYHNGAHPRILEALAATNSESYGGYGLDPWCEKAAAAIQDHLGTARTAVHFLIGGTQANYTVIAAALRPYEGIISADTGHIHVHETGAVENTGHKILALPAVDGKVTAEAIAGEAEKYGTSGVKEHIVEPKMVYLSFPTEYGTLYSKAELTAIHEVCQKYGLYLFIDGARLAYGLASEANDVTLADLAALSDAFTVGGTKCGALFGEALVLVNDGLKGHFRSYMKQNGAMLAKGWLLGIQFYTLFKEGLYFDIARRADEGAMVIKKALAEKGIPFYIESPTNQQFVVLTEAQCRTLAGDIIYDDEGPVDGGRRCVRLCTSWSTTGEEVEALVKKIKTL